MESPKVTVIISTFNRPLTLRQSVESVLNQTFQTWELILINDGGEDVQDVVDDCKDPRIKYFNDGLNLGAAYRFDQGLRLGRGDYACHLGDDDLFYPNHLETLVPALDRAPETTCAVYSDQYAVMCITDEKTGIRVPLDKRVAVTRNFNRSFEWQHNHILHISALFRRQLALDLGGYDTRAKVIIEWSLWRRFCFDYDFLYVPVLTGEYYTPMKKSDRISVVQRKDRKSYRHNIRLLKGAFPENKLRSEGFRHVRSVDVLIPMEYWNLDEVKFVEKVIDSLAYPVNYVLGNACPNVDQKTALKSLGKNQELSNLRVPDVSMIGMNKLEQYQTMAALSNAEFIMMVDKASYVTNGVPQRLLTAFEAIEDMREMGEERDGIKWEVPPEMNNPFVCLVNREAFLHKTHPDVMERPDYYLIKVEPSRAFDFDKKFQHGKQLSRDGKIDEAYDVYKDLANMTGGVPPMQFMAGGYTQVLCAAGKHEEAAFSLRDLIDRGYKADNSARLGQVEFERKNYWTAMQHFRDGINYIGFKEEYLDLDIFPTGFPRDTYLFLCMIGMAECWLTVKQTAEASRYFSMAGKLRVNDPRPFTGFARILIEKGDLVRARKAIEMARRRNRGTNKEIDRLEEQITEVKYVESKDDPGHDPGGQGGREGQ